MQKVVGSSPISRFVESPLTSGFSFLAAGATAHTSACGGAAACERIVIQAAQRRARTMPLP
jgi:hypothetical protein